MKTKKFESISKIIDILIIITLTITCLWLTQPEFSHKSEWDFAIFIMFWANYVIFILLMLTWKKEAPYKKFFYLRLPQWGSATFGIFINLMFISVGELDETALIYIVAFSWPFYIGIFYYPILIVKDIISWRKKQRKNRS